MSKTQKLNNNKYIIIIKGHLQIIGLLYVKKKLCDYAIYDVMTTLHFKAKVLLKFPRSKYTMDYSTGKVQ